MLKSIKMKPVLIHTHFHRRKTGVTRSIENVLPFFADEFETYVYGNNVEGTKISRSKLKSLLFSNREVVVHCHRNNEILRMLFWRFIGAKFMLIASRHAETKPSGLTLKLLKKADKVVTLIKSMSNKLGIKNTIVGHGVDVDKFVPNSEKDYLIFRKKTLFFAQVELEKLKGKLHC